MAHELFFVDALLPTRVCVLKLPLLPYSIGHEILLLKARNPLFCEDEATFNDRPAHEQRASVIAAALICARPWAEQNELPPNLRAWSRLLGGPLLSWRGHTLLPGFRRTPNYALAIADFRNYLHEAHAGFPAPSELIDEICAEANGYTPMNRSRGRVYGAPHLARLIHFVGMHPALFDARCIFDVPYAMAGALYATHLEADGNLRIENAEEIEERQNWAKIQAEVEAAEPALRKAEKQSRASAPSGAGLATPPPDLNPKGTAHG